jgi:hypothetical protein
VLRYLPTNLSTPEIANEVILHDAFTVGPWDALALAAAMAGDFGDRAEAGA